jgi:transcriptional regulator with XRE-family HTH domain
MRIASMLIQRRPSVLVPDQCRRAIRARGMTLEGFAAVAGVSRKTLGDWLAGRRSCQITTELKVVRALRDCPVLIPADLDQLLPLPMPSQARELVGPPARPRGEEREVHGHRRPSPSAYLSALAAVPPLTAWETFGYRLVPSGRAGSAFRRHLAEGKPWLAFPDVVGDEESWRLIDQLSLGRVQWR